MNAEFDEAKVKFEPTEAQLKAVMMVEKRDWPAGEPRIDWINKATAKVLLREGMIAERPNTARRCSGNIVDLTPAGIAVLAANTKKTRGTK